MKNMFAVEGINDYTSGYRAYKGSLLIKGFNEYGSDLITEKGFTCMAELLIKLSFIETNFKEIPFILRYDYKKGQSKMRVIQTIMKYIFLWSYLKKLREVKNHH